MMSERLDDLRDDLQHTVTEFDPSLDAADLAKRGSRRHRTRMIAGAVTGVAAFAVVVGVGLPLLRPSAPSVAATPAPTSARPAPTTSTAPTSGDEPTNVDDVIAMKGWVTFSSTAYPIAFQHPSDWTVTPVPGPSSCGADGCSLVVRPPDGDDTAPVELVRNASAESDYKLTSAGVVLSSQSLPGGWTDARATSPTQVVVATTGGDRDDYFLGVTTDDEITVSSSRFALGETNPLAEAPDSRFTFGTRIASLGGQLETGRQGVTIAVILSSARPNPEFVSSGVSSAPSTAKPGSGIATPTPGAVVPASSWETLTAKDAGISLAVAPGWTVRQDKDQQNWTLTAASGYQLVLQLARDGDEYFADTGAHDDVLTRLDQLTVTGSMIAGYDDTQADVTGHPELRWDSSKLARLTLTLTSADGVRTQNLLHVGTHRGFMFTTGQYPGGPTPAELDQAVAMMTSVRELR